MVIFIKVQVGAWKNNNCYGHGDRTKLSVLLLVEGILIG